MPTICIGLDGYPAIEKATPDRLDYSFNWAPWLLAGDSVTEYAFSLVPAAEAPGLQIDATGRVGPLCTAWLVGGVNGVTTDLRCRITTAQGRVVERTLRIAQVIRRGV